MNDFIAENITLVIGNGFDLSLGLKTKYSDFINEVINPKLNNEFTVKRKKELLANEIFKYLEFKSVQNWIDIENELKNNAFNHIDEYERAEKAGAKLFMSKEEIIRIANYEGLDKENYIQLKVYLEQYLSQIEGDISDISRLKNAFKLIEDIIQQKLDLSVINFNYTNTFDYIYSQLNDYSHDKLNLINMSEYHVHGYLNEGIVFGIDDKVDIPKNYIYLLKSYDRNTSNVNFNSILNSSKKVIFFGYSLGLSDASYFEDFFQSLCEFNTTLEEKEKREIVFYYKGEEDYNNIFYRLKELTKHNTAKLLRYNKIEFINVDYYVSCFY